MTLLLTSGLHCCQQRIVTKNTNYFYAVRISISLAILSEIFSQIRISYNTWNGCNGNSFPVPQQLYFHSHTFIPTPVPIPMIQSLSLPFPWESHGTHGIPIVPIPMHISKFTITITMLVYQHHINHFPLFQQQTEPMKKYTQYTQKI